MFLAYGHEVNYGDRTFVGFKISFENERVFSISASDALLFGKGRNFPATVFRFSKQSGKAGARVEPGPA
jgi:hypothetical protein